MTLAERTSVILRPNPQRVLARLFIPGEEHLIVGKSRAKEVVARCMNLSESTVQETFATTIARFGHRHRELEDQLLIHFCAVENLVDPSEPELSRERKMLIGAYFTQEYSFESAAYFNPSMVAHPDQSGLSSGYLRIIMSVRAVGEGHISSLVFRSGIINPIGEILIDSSPHYANAHAKRNSVLNTHVVKQTALASGCDDERLDLVLGLLPSKFTPADLEVAMSQVIPMPQPDSEPDPVRAVLQSIGQSGYEINFSDKTPISEQVLWPTSPDERGGIEDARWVHFTKPDGSTSYVATYTAYDGQAVTTRVFETQNFRNYTSTNLTGSAITNKGVALFPRTIDGKYLAMSRWDRESNSIAFSDDGYHWDKATTIQVANQPWEIVHIGNCGSPLETEYGWIVITHGTGPMREYCLGAILLDLQDPTKVIGRLSQPLLSANADERNGYVPNVVYSCGGLIHNGTIFLPYGFSDFGTRIATVNVAELVDAMLTNGPDKVEVLAGNVNEKSPNGLAI